MRAYKSVYCSGALWLAPYLLRQIIVHYEFTKGTLPAKIQSYAKRYGIAEAAEAAIVSIDGSWYPFYDGVYAKSCSKEYNKLLDAIFGEGGWELATLFVGSVLPITGHLGISTQSRRYGYLLYLRFLSYSRQILLYQNFLTNSFSYIIRMKNKTTLDVLLSVMYDEFSYIRIIKKMVSLT